MATIEFRAKPEPLHYAGEDEPRYMRVKVPILDRNHCDMNAFRLHPKYGAYANSSLFPAMLARIRADRLGNYIDLSDIPDGVTVKEGFLFTVSISID